MDDKAKLDEARERAHRSTESWIKATETIETQAAELARLRAEVGRLERIAASMSAIALGGVLRLGPTTGETKTRLRFAALDNVAAKESPWLEAVREAALAAAGLDAGDASPPAMDGPEWIIKQTVGFEGYGWYAYPGEYPDEGSEYLGCGDDPWVAPHIGLTQQAIEEAIGRKFEGDPILALETPAAGLDAGDAGPVTPD